MQTLASQRVFRMGISSTIVAYPIGGSKSPKSKNPFDNPIGFVTKEMKNSTWLKLFFQFIATIFMSLF